ncbi:putative sporulation protein YtaF [Carboxydocella sporoproducens DSM 16521]|uniref:Putative sporulation protein YtaF n=2 Tax=Carboxydocella TaxID=178898 RepID=A0A1T4L9M6_9FIRM|nr:MULTISPECIES: sporulation membrane protein YtaF [Carboxydocella]AVX19887.1 putative sporulation protein YtaF [Carboxydocella thermautotrophica]SJZ51482.1 putative sporulation protein YtaF [Carboxydocella sporoproducens DSM 16521]
MNLLVGILFAVALSLDGLAAGMAYGLRQIRVPWYSLLIISLASSATLALSLLGGKGLYRFLPAVWAEKIGGLILIGVGIWIFAQRLGSAEERGEKEEATLVKFRIPGLGLIIQILREPQQADLDRSGVISPVEALWLGVALALDAFAAGIGLGLTDASMWEIPLLVGVTTFIMVGGGLKLGQVCSRLASSRWAAILPGMILVVLGINKLR